MFEHCVMVVRSVIKGTWQVQTRYKAAFEFKRLGAEQGR